MGLLASLGAILWAAPGFSPGQADREGEGKARARALHTTKPKNLLVPRRFFGALLFYGQITLSAIVHARPSRAGVAGSVAARPRWAKYEKECIKRGWKKVLVDVAGTPRKLLWKGPEGPWKSGAIVALHGGGGHGSNFGVGLDLGKPMEDFSALAIREGSALFSLDSTEDGARDPEGRPCGKRWDCVAADGRPNVDLPFIETVLDRTIPGLRPEGSAKPVFLTGISNGGFMAILAATHFPDRIAAFAPVAAGDPYGASMDMGTHPPNERAMAPAVFRDLETGRMIHEPGAAAAEIRAREKKWPERNAPAALRFKQFHHRGDGACDFSCMEKARKQLVEHGYVDDGPFILEGDGKRSVWNHFWQAEYNRPLCDYFLRFSR